MFEKQAIVFDLDNTLYPYRRFVASGFRAVAQAVARDHDVSCTDAFQTLCRARTHGARGRELQQLCAKFGLSETLVPGMAALMQSHMPELRLSSQAACVLHQVQRHWLIGVVTNGDPDVQARKVDALGLRDLADVIVCDDEVGTKRGEPRWTPFEMVLDCLQVRPQSAVFVGDDPVADIESASRAGMKTIYLRNRLSREPSRTPVACDGVVSTLLHVPALATRLVHREESRYVA